MAEVIKRKLLRCNLMHRRTGIGDRTHLICIEFFPINGLSFTIVFCVLKYKREKSKLFLACSLTLITLFEESLFCYKFLPQANP